MKYLKTYKELSEDAYLDYSSNGPQINFPRGDVGIGSLGGTNGGRIGAEFGSNQDVSSKGYKEQPYKFTIVDIKKRQSLKQKQAVDRLMSLDDDNVVLNDN